MWRLIAPGAAVTATSVLTSLSCGDLSSAGEGVPFRPPPWVFGVVWPVLYVTTGVAWSQSRSDVLYAIVTALLCLWLLLYSCGGGAGRVAAAVTAAAAAAMSVYLSTGSLWAMPLAAWLSFATALNVTEVLGNES